MLEFHFCLDKRHWLRLEPLGCSVHTAERCHLLNNLPNACREGLAGELGMQCVTALMGPQHMLQVQYAEGIKHEFISIDH